MRTRNSFAQALAVILCFAVLLPVSLRAETGSVIVTYDYDAFGNLLHSTGTTPNNYLYSGEQFDPDLGLYFNRSRYLNVSTGRFWTMDEFEGFDESPMSLHKYQYSTGDPMNRTDPSGRVTAAEEGEAADISAEEDAEDAQILQVLNGIERATEADEANEAAASAAKFLIQVLGITAASAVGLAALASYVKQRARECGCQSDQILFHYTSESSAVEIYATNFMFASDEYPPDFPAGAYATDIEPWNTSYTRTSLAQTLYFNPARQQRAIDQTTGFFVAICNDKQPPFYQLPGHPRQWVKTDVDGADLVYVHAIFWGANPMPR